MSAIPAVLDALVAAVKASPDLAAVLGDSAADRVLDGPAVADLADPEGIAIGASTKDESIQFGWAASDLVSPGSQHALIHCLAWSGSGSTVFTAHRERADLIVEAVETALADDRTLGGVVTQAWISGGQVTQEQTGRGALVIVEFQIAVDLF